jgi:DNA polymerase/3'-5' exonuclease PolX
MNHFKTFKVIKQGDKLVELYYQDAKIDIYIANKDNYEVLRLIRTGSEFHNKKLCGIAIRNGMRMKFDKGLVDGAGNVVANSEEGILTKLLGKNILPEQRSD